MLGDFYYMSIIVAVMIAMMSAVMKSVMLASNSLKIVTRCGDDSNDDIINRFGMGSGYDFGFAITSYRIIPNPTLFCWLHQLLIGQNLYRCL